MTWRNRYINTDDLTVCTSNNMKGRRLQTTQLSERKQVSLAC